MVVISIVRRTCFFLVALVVAMTAACLRTSELASPNAGRTVAYEAGVPNFDMEASATWQDGTPGIGVMIGIPAASLVFQQRADANYDAAYELLVRAINRDDDRLAAEVLREDSIRVETYPATQTFRSFVRHVHLDVAPGEYRVDVTVRDLANDQVAERRQGVGVVPPEDGPALSHIGLEWVESGQQRRPHLALHVPARPDSISAVVELLHGVPDDTLDVELRLLEVPADTSIAEPPHWFTPMLGSVAYRGALHLQATPKLVLRKRFVHPGRVTLRFMLPPPEPGVYRLEVDGRIGGQSARVTLHEERMILVKDANFPRVERIDQMVEALAYIVHADEQDQFEEASTPTELRRRFDALWGQLIPDRNRAARVMEMYYERIEAANLRFSAYKEGWKTDRGMVYVVMGPPLHVDWQADGEAWHYRYSSNDPTDSFFFQRVQGQGRHDVLDQYVLERHPFYNTKWRRAVERWRDGSVL